MKGLGRFILGLGLSACAAAAPPPERPKPAPAVAPPAGVLEAPEILSPEALEAHVKVLTAPAMKGRKAGSADEARAGRYLAERLAAFGVEAFDGGYVHRFPLAGGPEESLNVIGVIRGPAPGYVVIGAHIDHEGVRDGATYPGADDNASGVAVVLEIARQLASTRESPLARSAIIAFFGAEEIGLLGSRRFVAAPPVPRDQIAAMINVDMVGRPLVDFAALGVVKMIAGIDDERAIGVLGTADRPWLRAIVDASCDAHGLSAWAPEDLPAPLRTPIERIAKDRGDNAPFEWAGIPSVFFGNGEHDDYHEPSDTPDKLRYPLMALRGRAIVAALLALSHADLPPR